MRKAVDSVVVDDSCHSLATEKIFSLRERRTRILCSLVGFIRYFNFLVNYGAFLNINNLYIQNSDNTDN